MCPSVLIFWTASQVIDATAVAANTCLLYQVLSFSVFVSYQQIVKE